MKNPLLVLPLAFTVGLGLSFGYQLPFGDNTDNTQAGKTKPSAQIGLYRPVIEIPMLPESMHASASLKDTTDKFKRLAESSKALPLVTLLREKYAVSSDKARVLIAAVFKYSETSKVDPHILFGLIKVESGFNSHAVSPAGAIGLMQVVPDVHKKQVAQYGKNITDLLDVEFNIQMGSSIFEQSMKRSGGDINTALSLYNGSYGINSPYSNKVLTASSEFLKYTKPLKTEDFLS